MSREAFGSLMGRLPRDNERAREVAAEAVDLFAATIERAEVAEQALGNLLAIIHRDGGHHSGRVGRAQSVDDAHKAWGALMLRAEERIAADTREIEKHLQFARHLQDTNEQLRAACELGLGFVEAHAGHMPQSRLALIGRMREALTEPEKGTAT